ncbi:hypothetical protein [Pedobacter sp. MW01-1-1]|uniref:hypothetical protein n=1 Tax=Pedobacter sp. MW01-1-1 TaxID=3383027 RepID=UPI003FF0FFAC
MRNPELLTIRNEQIYARYGEMYFGQLMRDDEIFKILTNEFHLEKRTLYHIILQKDKEKAIAV